MTQGLNNALYRMYNSYELNRSYTYNNENICLYDKFFTIDISNKSDILCPLYCLNHVIDFLVRDYTDVDYNKIVISVNVQERCHHVEYKTIDSALRDTFYNSDYLMLDTYKVKDETFYGCKNLLLDDDFKILFMPCIKIDWTNREFKDYIILVDRWLLDSPNTILSKVIMKKLIPWYLSKKPHIMKHDMEIFTTPSILFSDLNNIIQSNVLFATNPYNILNEELNTLVDSIDYVC